MSRHLSRVMLIFIRMNHVLPAPCDTDVSIATKIGDDPRVRVCLHRLPSSTDVAGAEALGLG